MNYSTDQVINGIISYADNEVMIKLPTKGKWLMGTAIGIASNKTMEVINKLKNNPIVDALGVIDENGYIDIECVIQAMKSSADRYGDLVVEIPLVGKLTFSSYDIDRLRSYIQ